MRRTVATLVSVLALSTVAVSPVAAKHEPPPDVIELPDGFFPEGIAIGYGTTFYTGSLADGSIYAGDVLTGAGGILVPGSEGSLAVGMSFDDRNGHLWVAAGSSGTVRVYDTSNGGLVDEVFLGFGFVNDVIVAPHAAYLTNSFVPEVYEVPLDASGAISGAPTTIPLGGDFGFIPGAFNANGIEWDGGQLLVVNSAVGEIYTVEPGTGDATAIDLGGAVVNGDGLVLAGDTLYVVVGSINGITKIKLSFDRSRGKVVDTLESDAYDVPTTADILNGSLYAVNAKFNTPPTPDTPYEVVRVDR